MFGADIIYVPTREARSIEMEAAAARELAAGRRPYVIPIGASTPLGAAAFALAVMELLEQVPAPDFIVHATSSGGTQAGLIAGCALAGIRTRVLGISADEPASELQDVIRELLKGLGTLIGSSGASHALSTATVEVDDRFVGEGYGIPTTESKAAASLVARTEALTLDPTYTSKAMAGLIGHARAGTFNGAETVLFWHTGGLPMLMSEG
jgi:1-aminocyclopropane-1-carboxylate deaminase/D-cysteine desulfhydrase-like pyridoxal-dependent ACC family enzyme